MSDRWFVVGGRSGRGIEGRKWGLGIDCKLGIGRRFFLYGGFVMVIL